MDRLALARHQRHAALALRHQQRGAIRRRHRLARRAGDLNWGIGTAARRLAKFLAVRRQQRGAAIQREIRALWIDDHPLAEFLRGVDRLADQARGQHALGVVRQQHDIDARQLRQHRIDQALLDFSRRRRRGFPIGAQHVGGEMLGDEPHLAGGRPRRIAHQHRGDARIGVERGIERAPGVVIADQADEDAARAQSCDVARDIAGAADIDLAALRGDHRGRRLRRDARHLAIDEFIEHQIADAQHGLA